MLNAFHAHKLVLTITDGSVWFQFQYPEAAGVPHQGDSAGQTLHGSHMWQWTARHHMSRTPLVTFYSLDLTNRRVQFLLLWCI